jgi:hypothetical protein
LIGEESNLPVYEVWEYQSRSIKLLLVQDEAIITKLKKMVEVIGGIYGLCVLR